MVELINKGIFVKNGREIDADSKLSAADARKGTIAYGILSAHNTSGDDEKLRIRFDAMASHDITYVGIIQTARASGFKGEFPLPYVLTNCHNSLCAVGGTINEDDHVFGLSAARKYGGIFVPAHQAVIHSYMRECMSGCGKMILGSDSHTRYGALGTLAIGEGGPELAKQILGHTYDVDMPEVVAVYLTGKPRPGVGPQDVALAIIGAVFSCGFVKNKVMEFIGDGISNLPIEFRNGIDVMTTETTCLSSIWETDGETERYFIKHKRPEDYRRLTPAPVAYYDGMVKVDLSKIENMIALPFHPSNTLTIKELIADPYGKLLTDDVDLRNKITPSKDIIVDQGVIAGCAGGTFDNLCAAADILSGASTGCGAFSLSAYPASQPVLSALIKCGAASTLLDAGVSLRSAFCGPCFGAGDVPSNGALSIRHSTRNFPNREGSKPGDGQSAFVALMDARSIAATAKNGGVLTPATEINADYHEYEYIFDDSCYKSRVYNGFGKPHPEEELVLGPNIADWPEIPALGEDILMGVASVITDPVTTTDELIPSGETSSYRSNPGKLARFALSRKDPGYVKRAEDFASNSIPEVVCGAIEKISGKSVEDVQTGSVVCAVKPGDGSAREQAASCQRILGGQANISNSYANKRYRSNLINWGMLPFTYGGKITDFSVGDYVYVPGIKCSVEEKKSEIKAYIINSEGKVSEITLELPPFTDEERQIILKGCLINFNRI